jgi:hypothetical protein
MKLISVSFSCFSPVQFYSFFLLNPTNTVIYCGRTFAGDEGCRDSYRTGLQTVRWGNRINAVRLYTFLLFQPPQLYYQAFVHLWIAMCWSLVRSQLGKMLSWLLFWHLNITAKYSFNKFILERHVVDYLCVNGLYNLFLFPYQQGV